MIINNDLKELINGVYYDEINAGNWKVNHSFNLSYTFHLNICLSFVSRYNHFYCTTLFTC